jgi:hypothetical protein
MALISALLARWVYTVCGIDTVDVRFELKHRYPAFQ